MNRRNGRIQWLALLLVPVLIVLGAVGPASADPAPPPAKTACDALPSIAGTGCRLITGTSSGPGGAVAGVAGAAGKWAGEQALSGVVSFVAHGTVWLLGKLKAAIETTTTPDLSRPWFLAHYRLMIGEAALIALLLLLVAAGSAAVRRDGGQLARSVVMLPVAFVAAGTAVYGVQGLVALFDLMANGVSQGAGHDAVAFITHTDHDLAAGAGGAAGGMPLAITLLGAVIAGAGALLVWVDLLLRVVGIYVASLFLPVVFALIVWDRTRKWASRAVEVLVVLIASKFVIIAIIALGLSALAGAGTDGGGLSTMFVGGAITLLAVFVPAALLRSLPFMEAHATGIGHRRELGRASGAEPAGTQSRKVITAALQGAKTGGSGNGSAGSGGGRGGAAAAAAGGPAAVASLAAVKSAQAVKGRATGQTGPIPNLPAASGQNGGRPAATTAAPAPASKTRAGGAGGPATEEG